MATKTRRRGRNEGSIYFLDEKNLWAAQIQFGHDKHGQRKRKTLYGKTKAEVQRKLANIRRELDSGMLPDPSAITVRQYLDLWLDDKNGSLRPTTIRRYKTTLNCILQPMLGHLALQKLQPLDVQKMLNHLRAEGSSRRNMELAYVNLNTALNDAVKLGYLTRNPCDGVTKPRSTKGVVQVLSIEEVGRFLAAARDDRLYALYQLALATGMRQGELFALHWEHVDLKRAFLNVVHQLQNIRGAIELVPPKSAKGRRRIDLDTRTIAVLKQHRQRMLKEGKPHELVFRAPNGGFLRRSNFIQRSFRKVLSQAGIEKPIRFHDLRHTAATLLLRQGVHAKIVQERLGHANIAMTLDIYSHVLPSMQAGAVEQLNHLWVEIGNG
jgi:integrase